MGCGSSREADLESAGAARPSPAVAQTRSATNHATTSQTVVSQTPSSQSTNQVNSPVHSRAALNPPTSQSSRSGPAISSPHQFTTRHRHRGTAEADPSTLSEHYNLPLQNPKAWKSQSRTWTPSQLRRERRDFFDTRVAGHREVWEALRQVTECIQESDIATAQGILDAANITLPTGHIEEGCYDERGFLYRIPEEILTDPTNLQPEDAEVDGQTVVGISDEMKAKLSSEALSEQSSSLPKVISEKQQMSAIEKDKEAVPEDALQLKCRMSDSGSDILSFIARTEPVAVLAARLKNLAQIPSYAKIEVFYLGKKLDQKKTIEEQDYMQNHVLNIFVVGAPR